MAKEKEKKDEAAEPEEKKKGGALGLLALLIGLINLGGIGFVGWKVVSLPPPAMGAEQTEIAPAPQTSAPGPIKQLDPFVVNLDEPTPRYLKTTLSLELTAEDALPEIELGEHQVRDDFLRYLSSLKVEDTRGEAGKTKIRDELLARAKAQLGQRKVQNLYFGEFVIQ